MITFSIKLGPFDNSKGMIIRHVTIERLTGLDHRAGTGDHDAWYTYYWTVRKGWPAGQDRPLANPVISSGTLEHRYGDGAEFLCAKVLEAHNRITGPTHPARS